MSRDYLEGFFPLSLQLARRIAQANRRLLDEAAAQSLLKAAAREEAEYDYEEDAEFEPRDFKLLDCLTLVRRDYSPDRRVEACRRTVRERLYRYLAFLARSTHARRGLPMPIFKVLPEAMEHLLGLEDREERFVKLPFELTEEFRHWLVEEAGGSYEAPWGVVSIRDEGELKLTANDSDVEEPPARAARESFSAPRRRILRSR